MARLCSWVVALMADHETAYSTLRQFWPSAVKLNVLSFSGVDTLRFDPVLGPGFLHPSKYKEQEWHLKTF